MITERRLKVRYPLDLAVHYQSLDRVQRLSGEGRTVNVSSSGLLMTAPNELEEGMRMRFTIEWPSLLNGTTPLQLVTTGIVVRRTGFSLAVALEHYQFRTMGKKRTRERATVLAGEAVGYPNRSAGGAYEQEKVSQRTAPAAKKELDRAPELVARY